MEQCVPQKCPHQKRYHCYNGPFHTLQFEFLWSSFRKNVRIIIEVSLEVEAAQSEFVKWGETLWRFLVLHVYEIDYLKGEQELIADYLVDQRTQQKQYETNQRNNLRNISHFFRGLRILDDEESIFPHYEGNIHLRENRFFLSKNNYHISIVILKILRVLYLQRQSVVFEGVRNHAVWSICGEQDTVCLYKLRNCYLGRESEGENSLVLKGDFLGFYKLYWNLFDDNAVWVFIIGFGALERVLYRTVLRAPVSTHTVTIIAFKSKSYSISADLSALVIDTMEPLLASTLIVYGDGFKVLPLIAQNTLRSMALFARWNAANHIHT